MYLLCFGSIYSSSIIVSNGFCVYFILLNCPGTWIYLSNSSDPLNVGLNAVLNDVLKFIYVGLYNSKFILLSTFSRTPFPPIIKTNPGIKNAYPIQVLPGGNYYNPNKSQIKQQINNSNVAAISIITVLNIWAIKMFEIINQIPNNIET